jgi:hypothetical protein
VVYLVLFFYWTLELVRQCGIFGFIFLLDFRTGSTVWYIWFYFAIEL